MGKRIEKSIIEKAVKESYTIADVCRRLGWQPRGGNYKYVHRYIDEYNIDTTHFTGSKTNIGNANNKDKEKAANYYLTTKSYVKANVLKWKLVSEGLKEYKCERCGCNVWNGEQITLQLHHINGDDTDNRLENLQMLCPNCHSQTDNYCGRNLEDKKIKKIYYCKSCHKVMEKTISGLCDECYGKLIKGELELNDSIVHNKRKFLKKCPDCGKDMDYGSTRCDKCHKKLLRKVEWPTKEELAKLIVEQPFVRIAKQYGVSDKAVTKWCKHYGLPYRKKDIKMMIQLP